MIQAAIIGLGVISRTHIAAIESLGNARLIAACDTEPSKNTLLPAGTAFYTDYEEMFRREKPDVVHICLPHFLHYRAAQKAAEAGFNIFAEKPLAMNGAEAAEYVKLEEQYGVKICLCLQNRLNTTSETLRQFLQSGEYGRVTGVRGSVAWYRSKEYYEAGPWRGLMAQAGGGCMINQAIHTMDLMQYFAGSPIVSVKGTVGQVLDYGIEVEDTAVGHILFENGAVGLFTASVANYTDENVEISVRCEKGEFVLRDKKLLLRGTGPGDKGEDRILASDSTSFVGKAVYGNSHDELIGKFYRAVESGGGWYIHPEEGVPSLLMIDAIRESSRTGKTVYFNR
ncbi:MAG: Gfo/Idh/MocA family oxidoreductase [Treponema sp.]|jgi:predicted dehydrogenase|nr:Gfo/Idh/MocA family oxidoreductase [Treponema sp.]